MATTGRPDEWARTLSNRQLISDITAEGSLLVRKEIDLPKRRYMPISKRRWGGQAPRCCWACSVQRVQCPRHRAHQHREGRLRADPDSRSAILVLMTDLSLSAGGTVLGARGAPGTACAWTPAPSRLESSKIECSKPSGAMEARAGAAAAKRAQARSSPNAQPASQAHREAGVTVGYLDDAALAVYPVAGGVLELDNVFERSAGQGNLLGVLKGR
jgi:hypothetical protein